MKTINGEIKDEILINSLSIYVNEVYRNNKKLDEIEIFNSWQNKSGYIIGDEWIEVLIQYISLMINNRNNPNVPDNFFDECKSIVEKEK